MPKHFNIKSWSTCNDTPPLIVAELGANHGGDLERALQIVDAAGAAGAHAIKLQTYTPETITLPKSLSSHIIGEGSLWQGQSLRDLYQSAHLPWKWHAQIFQRAQSLGMWAFSSPFDETAVDFLEKFNVPAYKVASLESTHLPLLSRIAKTGKPIIISTGATQLAELVTVVDFLKKQGCRDVILLRCTSAYPARAQCAHLQTLPHLSQLFDLPVGLSDHTLGIGVAVAAVALGARVIEKHLTLSRDLKTFDRDFSLEPSEFRQLVTACEQAHQALGKITYDPLPEEQSSLELRSSIYAVRGVDKDQIIQLEDLKIGRPAKGLSPLDWHRVLGKKAKIDIKAGTPLQWDLLN